MLISHKHIVSTHCYQTWMHELQNIQSMLARSLSLSPPISLFNIGIVAWFICYMIIGSTAAPGGRLFGLVVLTVAANFGGFLVSLINLPRLIGMLATGILFQVCSHSFALEKALENCVGHICTCFV